MSWTDSVIAFLKEQGPLPEDPKIEWGAWAEGGVVIYNPKAISKLELYPNPYGSGRLPRDNTEGNSWA